MSSKLPTIRLKCAIGPLPAGSIGTLLYRSPFGGLCEAEFTVGEEFNEHQHEEVILAPEHFEIIDD